MPESQAPIGGPAHRPHAQPRLVVAAAIVDSLSRPTALLCAARSYPPALAGRFELPGGKVEPGEDPRAALDRELAEEIELRVRCGEELVAPPHLAVAPPGLAPAWPIVAGLRMRVWLAEADPAGQRARAGADHEELRWVPLASLLDLPWLEADIPIVEALQAHLGLRPARGCQDHPPLS